MRGQTELLYVTYNVELNWKPNKLLLFVSLSTFAQLIFCATCWTTSRTVVNIIASYWWLDMQFNIAISQWAKAQYILQYSSGLQYEFSTLTFCSFQKYYSMLLVEDPDREKLSLRNNTAL